ncbi:hypothetical protein UK23_27060 [Lentzea aerocolonigenes]|uniref:Uncharacterized protein n=1 Tax=Lentzea aerocolonigenes TaxID=68170 RepID=A0A0F0GRG0_LENAE|nr:hypothetical protein [Lentzea aerocolonigenes]KJK45186.1 hypothetical protein UK23_27060 [Lentzea aerocolonigenes]
MNEQDLKRAFEDVVVASSPPPSMDPGRALDVARKARSKRRSSLVGAVVAVLVVGVGLGTAFALNPKGTTEYMTGAGASSSSSSGSSTGMPDTQWGEQWPVGQSDRTATNGPQADRGTQLLHLLMASAPAGYDTPDLKYKDPSMYGGMLRAQAQISTDKGEVPEIWQYTAYVPVRKGDKVGKLTAHVSMPDPRDPTEPCALSKKFQRAKDAGCKLYEVGGKQIGVASPASLDQGTATWATYRAANGWTVTIMQENEYPHGGYPALDGQLFLAPQLAALAMDPKFLLGS